MIVAVLVAVNTVAGAKGPDGRPSTRERRERDGYVLMVACDDASFDPALIDSLVDTFFRVYPVEARIFNPAAVKSVDLSIERGFQGIAETEGARIRLSAAYFRAHPRDIDVITHEAMHVVQAYPPGGPGWLVEGIADYARYRFGVNNSEAGWSLPDVVPTNSYTDSYRVTARFLVWIDNHRARHFVARIDQALRHGAYGPDVWKRLLGQAIDQVWNDYLQSPTL